MTQINQILGKLKTKADLNVLDEAKAYADDLIRIERKDWE